MLLSVFIASVYSWHIKTIPGLRVAWELVFSDPIYECEMTSLYGSFQIGRLQVHEFSVHAENNE